MCVVQATSRCLSFDNPLFETANSTKLNATKRWPKYHKVSLNGSMIEAMIKSQTINDLQAKLKQHVHEPEYKRTKIHEKL